MGAVDVGFGRMSVIQPRWQPRFDLHGYCVVISMYVGERFRRQAPQRYCETLFAHGKVQQDVMLY